MNMFLLRVDGAMAMKIDIVRHLFFQHLFPRKAERVNNFVKICIARGRCLDRKTRQNTEVGFILIFIYLDFRLVVALDVIDYFVMLRCLGLLFSLLHPFWQSRKDLGSISTFSRVRSLILPEEMSVGSFSRTAAGNQA